MATAAMKRKKGSVKSVCAGFCVMYSISHTKYGYSYVGAVIVAPLLLHFLLHIGFFVVRERYTEYKYYYWRTFAIWSVRCHGFDGIFNFSANAMFCSLSFFLLCCWSFVFASVQFHRCLIDFFQVTFYSIP